MKDFTISASVEVDKGSLVCKEPESVRAFNENMGRFVVRIAKIINDEDVVVRDPADNL
jgi:hypothetical protein